MIFRWVFIKIIEQFQFFRSYLTVIYQVRSNMSSSYLRMLSFPLHQCEKKIECSDAVFWLGYKFASVFLTQKEWKWFHSSEVF